MKHPPIPQYELSFTRDTFNLIVEQTQDGERVEREQREIEQARKQAEKQQTDLIIT